MPAAGQGAPVAKTQHRSYEPLGAAEEADLRRTLADCARVEVHRSWIGRTREKEVVTLTRGGELDALLAQLLAVPRYYRATHPTGLRYTPSRIVAVRFFDAAGKPLRPQLTSFKTQPNCYFYADAEGTPIVLTDIFAACLPAAN